MKKNYSIIILVSLAINASAQITTRISDGNRFISNAAWTTRDYHGTRLTFFADVNGDRKADAIFVNDDFVVVWPSYDGSFRTFHGNKPWTDVPYYGSRGIYFADVNGDGRADAIVVNDDLITVRISDGTKFLPNASWTSEPYYGSRGTYFADVNGDSKADAIVINDDLVTVRISDGTKFLPNASWTSEPYYGSRGTYFADVNGDGKADAIVINDDLVTVRLSDGTKFTSYASWTSEPYYGSKGTYFEDVNGDRRADAIVVNDDLVTVRLSDGTRFTSYISWTQEPYYGMIGTYFSDANGDGKADAIVVNTGGMVDNNLVVDKLELAFRYAPIHYQDTDNSNARGDYITSVDYDKETQINNWNTSDNWDHIFIFDLAATGYYSIVETCTHWYITYAFYHPRDWDETNVGEHENDLEGIIVMVRKDGTMFGKIEGAITISHVDLYSFVPDGTPLSNGGEDIDGKLSFIEFEGSLHPVTSQEAKGHGLKAYPFIGDFSGKSSEDGIIYFPSRTTGQVPTSGNDRHVLYQLTDIFTKDGLWDHQLADIGLDRSNASVFASFGNFKGDGSGGCGAGLGKPFCDTDGANAPWNWDGNYTDSHRGDWGLDPANLFQKFYSGLGQFDTRYLSNKFISDLMNKGYNSSNKPGGWNDAIDMNTLFSKLINKCQ